MLNHLGPYMINNIFPLFLIIISFTTSIYPQNNIAANFEIQEIGKNIYAVIRKDPPGLMCDGNSVIIINKDHVVIVDAPEASNEIIKELKKMTDKPVRYVINTHWHDDHITGNQAYHDAYPNAEFIAHKNILEYLPHQGLINRNNMISSAPGGVEYLKSLLEKNESMAGGPMTDEERVSFINDIALVEHYLDIVPNTEYFLPKITFNDKYILEEDKKIEIIKAGNAHTAGDIVVFLPDEKILITGDIVVHPVPLVGAEQSHIDEWGATLDKLISKNAKTIVPGHGKVMHDNSYLSLLSGLFNSICRQTKDAVAQGKTLDEIHTSIDLEEFREEIAGDSQLKKILFNYYVKGPGVTAAFNELNKK